MKITFTALALGVLPLLAGASHSQSNERAQVMLFGVFHFANPGLDVVKTDTINDGKYELPANEIYQLGFRIARLSGVERIASFYLRTNHVGTGDNFVGADATARQRRSCAVPVASRLYISNYAGSSPLASHSAHSGPRLLRECSSYFRLSSAVSTSRQRPFVPL